MTNFQIIKHKKIYFLFSGSLILAGIISLALFGARFSRDFQGGSFMELQFNKKEVFPKEIFENKFQEVGIQKVMVEFIKNKKMVNLEFETVTEEKHQQILESLKKELNQDQDLEELRFETIGPIMGQEFKNKTIWAIILACLAIIIYVAYAFRKVSEPVASWKYGITAVIALVHDVFITFSIFIILGKIFKVEIDALFITALLTVLGYSVNDTLVVFDRIRENLIKADYNSFEDCVNQSVNQTMRRSLFTSLTTVLVLSAILILGGETIFWFILALTCGILIGTYSSIFLASPLLVVWEKWKK